MATQNRLGFRPMALDGATIQAFLGAMAEPALVMRRGAVQFANEAAKELFGSRIERSDVRLAIRNPKALAHILPGKDGDIDVTGIGGFGRPWTLSVRGLGGEQVLVRFIDKSAAAAAERMRVDFVANASHELRTPLTAIVGYAETLAEDDDLDRDNRVNFGRTISSEARRMLRIIEDLMSLSRIEADRFVAPTASVAIDDIVRSAVEQARQTSSSAGIEFDVDIAADLPAASGDHAQLSQLCDNLISNAVRYGRGPNGEPIRVIVDRIDSSVRVSVADSGQGVAPDQLRRLTERFYRVDEARSRGTGGTGLGLAIVKHIVERHRGSLEILSDVGVGTTVVVTFPIGRPAGL